MHERITDTFSLAGRVAVITGAASGIGRETAIVYAQAGAKVVLADVNQNGLEETADIIGSHAVCCSSDIADRASIATLARHAMAIDNRIDIWANVAGITQQFSIVDAEEADLDQMIAINLKGTYWGCAVAGKAMADNKAGSIINISSTAGDSSPAGMSAYAMTKAGVNALTRSAAKEFGLHGIRVNAVAPGYVETPMVSFRYTDSEGVVDEPLRAETLQQRRNATPLNLTGEPSDIAYAMLYLGSDASRYVTGQVLHVNGGVLMR